jgi:hypothetical protein
MAAVISIHVGVNPVKTLRKSIPSS